MWKQEKTESLFQRLAADFFQTVSNGTSLITITACRLSPDGKHAAIVISVLPAAETPLAYEFAKRQLHDLRDYIRARARVHRIPRFDISLALTQTQ
ncbi:MAG: hypothetical protein AAB819_03475 [Patescibacteria group bacterium]